MKSLSKVFATLVAVGFMAGVAEAQAPEMFRYQGRLVDDTNLVNATLPISFKLYDALSDGALLYEDSNDVLVVDGLYSTMIGDDTILGSLTNALTNTAVYLELTVDGETLSPRERLVSVPYALKAQEKDGVGSGGIVLSETYPNLELEAEGYTAVAAPFGVYCERVFSWSTENFKANEATIVVWNNELWKFNYDSAGCSVMHSTNGIFWECAASNLFASLKYGSEMIPFKGKLFVVGYKLTSSPQIWASANGTSWSLQTTSLEAGDITGVIHLAVANEKLWLFGSGQNPSKLWSSTDGLTWNVESEESFNDPFLIGYGNDLLLFDREGGTWKFTDSSWINIYTQPPYAPKVSPKAVSIAGGELVVSGYYSRHSSGGGTVWEYVLHDSSLAGVGREKYSEVYFQGALWAINGDSNNGWTYKSYPCEQTRAGLYVYRKD